MSNTVTLPASERIPQGDARKIPFRIVDGDGNPVNLTAADIVYELRERAPYDPELSLSDSGVSIVDRDNDAGEFAIKLDTGATGDLEPQTYRERLRVTDSNGNQTTWIGEVPIVEDS